MNENTFVSIDNNVNEEQKGKVGRGKKMLGEGWDDEKKGRSRDE